MKANPGGYIPPEDVIGRDELIKRFWRILERQSLVLCSERRMGKTSIINKMVAEAPKDKFLPIYRDLEGVKTPLEFVREVIDDVYEYLSRLGKATKKLDSFLSKIGKTKIGGVIELDIAISHWKDLLTNTIEDLVENQDHTVILFWDELPVMLYDIKKNNNENLAMEILDTLRSLRQMHPELKMVFTGSIGIHNVITSLKRAGSANDPTNDMYTEEVPPLSLEYAKKLALQLLEGEGIRTDDPPTTAQAIVESVDCIPYYIHHIIEQMVNRKYQGIAENWETVDEIVKDCLTDSHDRWHMNHYCERVGSYYTEQEQPLALGLLDILATLNQPIRLDDLFNLLKSRIVTEDKEKVRSMLTLLRRDHYVSLTTDGTYEFRFPLIKRWWRMNRG